MCARGQIGFAGIIGKRRSRSIDRLLGARAPASTRRAIDAPVPSGHARCVYLDASGPISVTRSFRVAHEHGTVVWQLRSNLARLQRARARPSASVCLDACNASCLDKVSPRAVCCELLPSTYAYPPVDECPTVHRCIVAAHDRIPRACDSKPGGGRTIALRAGGERLAPICVSFVVRETHGAAKCLIPDE